jgi:glycosyltransferase involved in cell wall biosynthesis
MRVLIDHPWPFQLAHGGLQIQIDQTRLALEQAGVQADWLRWWDAAQRGDLIHYFGRMPPAQMRMAQQKGLRVVIADLLTGHGSRPAWRHFLHGAARRLLDSRLMRPVVGDALTWQAYQQADACIALTSVEADILVRVYGAPPSRVFVVPNGVEREFLESPPDRRGPWLVCTATITGRKRVLELARAAVAAQTPLWIIGQPYAEEDPYHRSFVEVARAHPSLVRFEGPINDRAELARIYRQARGFVLLSRMESQSLSALEAAACECPLLLSDLPWARTSFGEGACYCPVTDDVATAAVVLRRFHAEADAAPRAARPPGWPDIARQLKGIYERLLSTAS